MTISFVIVTPNDDRFVVRSGTTRIECPQLVLTDRYLDRRNLGSTMEKAMADGLRIRAAYGGLLGAEKSGPTYEFTAIALLQSPTEESALRSRGLRTIRLDDIDLSALSAERHEQFVLASQRRGVESHADGLVGAIERARSLAIDYLDRQVSRENGDQGWSQYLDGQRVGAVSTAQGILAHYHSGGPSGIVERMISTLEAIQNPDGGWQVRNALVGGSSALSITESTCFCLWALNEAGRTPSSPSVQRALTWLEETQRGEDGGWLSSMRAGGAQLSATASAVRVLAKFGRREAVARGVACLRNGQNPDGGWGATLSAPGTRQESSPAFAAHAVLALLGAGILPADRAVRSGCAYLVSNFQPLGEEPWRSTSTNVVVDDETRARLDWRHFATPWALAALSLAGEDLRESAVFVGTRRLLNLQDSSGAWRCSLAAPGTYPMWALHDALFALREVLAAATKTLGSVAVAPYRERERAIMQQAMAQLVADRLASDRTGAGGRLRARLQTLWLSSLTAAIALLLVSQAGLLRDLGSDSTVRRAVAAVGAALVATLSAIAPGIITEEYKMWRTRRSADSSVGGTRHGSV